MTTRTRKLGKVASFAGLLTLALAAITAPATAAVSGVTVSKSTGITDGEVITVNGTTSAAATLQISLCTETNAGATFNPVVDCSADSADPSNISLGGTFSAPYQVNLSLAGPGNVGNGIKCGPQPNGTSPKCRLRVQDTTDFLDSTPAGNQFVLLDFGTTNPVVPEAPLAVLLPIGALVVLGGGYYMVRRNRQLVNA